MPSITKKLILGLPQISYDGGVGAYLGVVCHSTANPNSNKENEWTYMRDHFNSAFTHFIVDWRGTLQSADTNYICYGAGPTANHKYVHVELCETDDYIKFQMSYSNYVWLVAKLLSDKKLPVLDSQTIWTHQEISGTYHETDHQDPVAYLKSHGKNWQNVIDDVLFEKAIACRKILGSPDYWRGNAVPGGKADGGYMNKVLLNFIAMFQACDSFDKVLDVSVNMGIISKINKDYWKNNAISGGTVEGGFARIVLTRMGSKI